MRFLIFLLAMGLVGMGGPVMAQTAGEPLARRPTVVDADAVSCLRTPAKCPRFKHVISFPAHALSPSSAGNFAHHARGVDWSGASGSLSLTLRRPKDFTGERVRLLLFYEVGDDSAGQIQFNLTPVSLKHGSGFETYGSFSTTPIAAPETLTILQERSVLITGGNGWNPAGGEWWYFQITRPGSFAGKLRLMSVALEY